MIMRFTANEIIHSFATAFSLIFDSSLLMCKIIFHELIGFSCNGTLSHVLTVSIHEFD